MNTEKLYNVEDIGNEITFPITDMKEMAQPVDGRRYMKKSKLELALDNCNHTMELVRTIVPILVLIIQIIILFKIL